MKGMSKSCQIRKKEPDFFFLDESLKTNKKRSPIKGHGAVFCPHACERHCAGITKAEFDSQINSFAGCKTERKSL